MMMGLFGMSGKSSRSDSNRSALDPEAVDPTNDVPKAASPTAASSVSKDTGEKSFETPLTQDTMSDTSDHSLDDHAPEAGEPAVVDTNSPQPPDDDFIDQQRVSQMKKLAESLGLPPSVFGITEDGTSDLSGWNPNQGPLESAFLEKNGHDVSNHDSSDDKEQDEAVSISADVGGEEKGEDQVAKIWHGSFDETMLSNTDDDHHLENLEHRPAPAEGEWQSTPVRREFKPHPTTLAEKRQAKEDAVSRLNRIKAKAVKSVTKSLGVDENNLSYAVGLSTDAHLTKTARKKMANAPNMDDPDHVQFIADALGLPIEMFGVTHLGQKSSDTVTTPWPVSLAHELGMHVEDTAISINASETLESGIPTQPQAGSLAAALGMAVDDSEGAPPVRHVTFESTHVGPNDPNPGLLPTDSAANQSVPPTTSASSGDHTPAVPQLEQPREGSLAQALGMAVTSSPLNKSRQSNEEEAESPARALGMGVGSSASVTSTISRQSGQAQPGSLAFALGMSVDYSENAPPIQSVKSTQVLIAPLPELGRVGLAEKFATLGTTSRDGAPKLGSPRQILRPQEGSPSSALEMKVDYSIKSPIDELAYDHDQSISSTDSDSSADDSPSDGLSSQPKPGSLAAALGMQVDPGYNPVQWQNVPQDQTLLGAVFCNVLANVSKLSSSNLKSLGSSSNLKSLGSSSNLKSLGSNMKAQPKKGSLADALGMRITEDHGITLARESKAGCGMPQDSSSGSLAAALGMTIHDELPMNAKDFPIAPVAGSLAAALGITAIGQSEMPVVKEESRGFSAPLPGSLAAALGIAIKDDHKMPAPSKAVKPAQSNAPMPGSLAAALGMAFSDDHGMPAPSKSVKATQSNAPRPGSLAAALGMAIGDDHEIRASPKYVRPKTAMPGSLAAAQGMVSSDDRKIPANTTSAKSARSNAPLPGSLAAALGLAISDNSDMPTHPKSARSDARPNAPLPGSLAAALGMATSDKHEILPHPKSKARAGKLHAAAPGSLAAALGVPVCKDNEIAVEQKTSQVRCFVQPVAGSLAAALGMVVSDDQLLPMAPKEQAHTGQAKVAVAGSLAAALGVAVSEDPELPPQNKSSAHQGRFMPPVAGSFAAGLGIVVNDENEMSRIQKSQVRALQHRDPAAGSLAAALGMVVSEQEAFVSLQTSRVLSEPARAAPVAGSLAAALGMVVSEQEAFVSVQTSRVLSEPARAAPVAGSLAAALGMMVKDKQAPLGSQTCQARSVQHRAAVPGSLAAALGIAVSDEELSVSVTNSPIRFEPPSEAPDFGSSAAALGMAVNCAYRIPSMENSDVHLVGNLSNASRVTKPQTRSLADALGMSVDTSNVAPAVREVKTSLGGIPPSSEGFVPTDGWQGPRRGHYFGTGPKGTGYYTDLYTSTPEPLPSTIIPRQIISQEASVEMASSEEPAAARTSPVLVAPNSDAEIRLVVELAAARAETAAAKAYGKAMEQQMSQMSKSYSMKLAGLQRQIASYEAELEEKSRALEAAEDQQQRSLGRSGDEEEMRDTQEGLIQRLCQSAERMTRTRLLLEEADSMLQTEINEIRTVKSGYDEQYHEEESVSSGSSGNSAESRSRASRDLQVKLAREDDRRNTIKARLQAMREAQA